VVVEFRKWVGPEANPSFLPEVLNSLEKPGATFVSPFSGIEVSPLEYLSSDPLSPIPPGKCFLSALVNGKLIGEVFIPSFSKEDTIDQLLDCASSRDLVYFIVLTNKKEELWKGSGQGSASKLFSRKRR
jgi:hypothetical protein